MAVAHSRAAIPLPARFCQGRVCVPLALLGTQRRKSIAARVLAPVARKC